MKQLRTLASAFLVCLMGVAGAWAQAPAAATPTAEQIFDKYVEAIGGRAALERVTSIVIRGTSQIEDVLMIGKVEIYAKAPNKTATIMKIPSLGVYRRAFDGTVGWIQGFGEEPREVQGQELEDLKSEADFRSTQNPQASYSQMTLLGKDRVGTREVYVIESKSVRGDPRKLFYDVESGLLLRRDITVHGREGKYVTQNYLDDYREVEGRKYPFRLRTVTPRMTHTIRVTSFQVNVPIDDAVFALPKSP